MAACDTNPCPYNRRRMPCSWIETIQNRLTIQTGKWADFNCVAKAQRHLLEDVKKSNASIMCEEDVPEFPDIDGFSDLESTGDLGC